MRRKKPIVFLLIAVAMLMAVVHSCKKDETPPHNPYDDIIHDPIPVVIPPDPNSIVGIHATILKTECAKSGCHDGNFEPDFRTVESSYATLVYHKIKKNNAANSFVFRVVPKDTAKSVLHERLTNCCFVNQNDMMPQDIIGIPLPKAQIDNIVNWIMAGAKDMFGNLPSYPNTEPKILYYYATNKLAAGGVNYGDTKNRIDSIFYNPFYVPSDSTLYLLFKVEDDSTAIANLQVNTLKISTKADDFSSAISFPATYVYVNPTTQFHLATINTGTLPKSDTLFMRYFVNDGDHANNTQFPTDNLVIQYKTYWSFFVKP